MLHLDKAVFSCCILCGMLAIYYMSVYVIVSVVIALLLFLYYESQVNWSRIHVRGLTRPSPLRKLLIYFRVWTDSAVKSVMKTFQQIRPVSQRSSTNGMAAYAEGNNLTSIETPRGNCTSNHYSGLDGENFEYSRRNSFSAYSSDSMHSSNRSYNRVQRSVHQTPSRYSGDLSFSPKGSPWGKSVSPKLRSHGAGVKTVQTVAGPLLASTRFNISNNIGMFGDVNSPGFSSRVARYASEDSKTLTHQKQYSGPGQFPIIHLDRSASRLPIISSRKSQRFAHSPVTIRIAPPESSDTRFLSKSQILGATSPQEQHSSKSVLEVLKEMSRKRIHAQLDDNEDDDMVKRKRKVEGQMPLDRCSDSQQVQGDIMAVGKRAREESPSQAETSCRPIQQQNKRTRNNEILSSLSSSRNLLNHLKTSTKRKSSTADWSRGSTPVMGKSPKQSCDGLRIAVKILKTATEATPIISSAHTATTSTTVPLRSICQVEEKSTDEPPSVKPSEFLPKFAAVLDKNSSPVLNSVAALEAKRAYDSRTRLRSMLAVIAGEDDFIRKPSSSINEVISSTAADAVSVANVTTTFPCVFPPASVAGAVKEAISAPETSVESGTPAEPAVTDTTTQSAGEKSLFLPTNISMMPNGILPAVSNTGFQLLGSVTSTPVTTSPSLTLTSSPASAPVSSEKKIPALILTPSSSANVVAPAEQHRDPFKISDSFPSQLATTSSSGISYLFGKSQSPSSSSLNSPKVSNGNASQLVTSTKSDLNGSSIPPSSKQQAGLGSLSNDSSSSGGFNALSASTVINVLKSPKTETTKGLFSFGNTTVPTSLNTTNSMSPVATSNAAFGSVFTVGSTRANVGQFGSPTSIATNVSSPTAVGLFGAAKSDDKSSTTASSGIKPAASSSNLFQLNSTTTSSATNSVGGFKFDITKGIGVNAPASTVGGFRPTLFLGTFTTASTATITTTAATTATSAITSVPPTTSVPISIPASTSQSESQFKFGTTVSKPAFNFSSTSTANGPTQSSGGFAGGIFGSSQPQTDGVAQKSQQSPFSFGACSPSQNQNPSGAFAFGGSSTSSGVKPGGFAFGTGNLSSQPTGAMFGGNASGQSTQSGGRNLPDQAPQPIFGSSGNKTDESQTSSGIFGTPQSSGRAFGSTQTSQPTGGVFGNSTTPSSGLFGSSGSSTGQVQSTGGIFGGGVNPSGQSVPSPGVFGSQMTQPLGGLFGSSGNLPATSTQTSVGLFGTSGSLTTQASGGIFGSSGNLSAQSSQPGLFGGIASPSAQTSQPSGGLFGSPSQPSGGIFGSSSSMASQPAGGVFGSGDNTQTVFGFGSTSSATPAQQPAASSGTGLFGGSTSLQATPFQFGAGSSSAASSAPQSAGGFNFGSSGVNASAPTINFTSGTSASTPFQFGAGATPAFGAQTPGQGMFSIGSGSTAPRARAPRVRRQR